MSSKIIAYEGIDGSGKDTQCKLMATLLEGMGKKVLSLSFPVYSSFIGKEIGKLLSGEEKYSIRDLDPKSICLWYALDRFEALKQINKDDYDYIILNRFSLSSIAFQCARQDTNLQPWIQYLEHEVLDLPIPDCYIILDVDPAMSKENVSKKSQEAHGYTTEVLDLNERDIELLKKARQIYLSFENDPSVEVISCLDDSGKMLSKQSILMKAYNILIDHCLV